MTKYNAPRYKKYPAAEAAVRCYLVLERLPEKMKPNQPGALWPEFLNVDYIKYLQEHPAYFEDAETRPARATPKEIDEAKSMVWLKHCEWMLAPGIDRLNWVVFQRYAKGWSQEDIGCEAHKSRQYIGVLLDMIFRTIQVEAELMAMRGDVA